MSKKDIQSNGYEALKAQPLPSILRKPGFDIPKPDLIAKPPEPCANKGKTKTPDPRPADILQRIMEKRKFSIGDPALSRQERSLLAKHRSKHLLAQAQTQSRKKHFKPPTDSPLPRVIKIHDPVDRKEDDQYFQRLVPTTLPSPSGWDDSSPIVKSSQSNLNEGATTTDETIIIVRVPPSGFRPCIPEVIGVFPKTIHGFTEVERLIRQPVADWKVYDDGDVDANDASIIAFGTEPDGSRIYVYQKPFRHSLTRAEQHFKEVFVVNRSYYYYPDGGEEHEHHDILGVFDTLAEANEAAPRLLEVDFERRLVEEGVAEQLWEEYEEEILGSRVKGGWGSIFVW